MRTHLSLFSIVYYNRHTNIGIINSKEITTTTITTTTATTTNNKVNANSDPRLVIQIVGQGRKYKTQIEQTRSVYAKLGLGTGNNIVN